MHVQSLSRLLPLLLLAASLLLLVVASEVAVSHSASTRYKECTDLAVGNPAQALERAKAWRTGNPSSPFARHCEALALYSQKRYAESADLLSTLSKEALAQKPSLSVSLLIQAADAYSMMGKYDVAIHLLSERLTMPASALAPELKVRLLTERARFYYALKQPKLAAQDVKEALAIDPDNTGRRSLLTDINKKNTETGPAR